MLRFFAVILTSASSFAFANPYEALIYKHSVSQGLDPKLVTAIITRESAFKANARSPRDARGLMQVIPSTARMVGVDPSRLYEPEQSIIAGTRYLAFLKNRFNGNLVKMIAGYNAGHGAVEKYNGIPPYCETQNYVRFVTAKYTNLSSGGSYASPTTSAQDDTLSAQRRSDMLVLAKWQQQQYYYNQAQIEAQQKTLNPQIHIPVVEPVRLQATTQQVSPTVQKVSANSHVQSLQKGQYVQVF